MEPITFLVKAVAVVCITAFPTQPTTVPGNVEIASVSNSTVITETANKLEAERIAAEKAAAEKAAAEKAAAEKAAAEKKAKEEAEAKAKLAATLHLPLQSGIYSYTSDYGPRCAPVPGAGDFHYGIDLAAPLGTPIYALAGGTVSMVIDGANGGQAGMVFIESMIDGKKITYSYAHMGNSSQYVKEGDKVEAGQHISDVASTGMSTGAHLHIEVWEGEANTGKRINPEIYLTAIGLDVVGNARSVYVNPNASAGCEITPRVPLQAASTPENGTTETNTPAPVPTSENN